ncbi:MAG: putative sulfate exporter family transporter [Pseudomonadota bacterium]|nr:putative sulfate exporter family transporter [Pseudomonadota bacterium]
MSGQDATPAAAWSAAHIRERVRSLAPGLLLAITIAFASRFISMRYGGPVMLYALLFGIAFNFLSEEARCAPGIRFASRTVLQIGVALLGAAITFGEAVALGPMTLALVAAGVVVTICGGYFIGRMFRLSPDHAFLSAGAVAICGASAAMAIAAVLPKSENSERNLVLTVVGVTTMSTAAMVLYPSLAQFLRLSDATAGVFLGATIHDVAQVVGAGHMISDETGAISAVVKLVRVAMLPGVVLFTAMAFRGNETKRTRLPALPLFVAGFAAVMLFHSFHIFPAPVFSMLSDISKWCLVIAVAAFGMRTSLKEIAAVGARPIAVLGLQTALLLGIVLAGLAVIS